MRAYVAALVLSGASLLGCNENKSAPAATPDTSKSAALSTDQPAGGSSAATTAPIALPQPMRSLPAPPDVAEPPSDAEKTPSGLASKVLEKGTGTVHPKPDDQVLVHYTGWTKDGHMFDSSVVRGTPMKFAVKEVIPGWTEGIQLMVEKEKRRFWIPGKLAYGDVAQQPGAPAGQLTFDVELVQIVPPPETPKDVAAAPADATKTASGLAFKVLEKGTGTEHPTADSAVVVHYSGWTKDGKMFDSSVVRGEPARFKLKQVIKGWTEGLQLMVVGEKARFWIPANLAYGDPPKAGKPAGQLTFDVELLQIQK